MAAVIFLLVLLGGPWRQSVDVGLTGYRLDVSVRSQTGCIEAESDGFFVDTIELTTRFTNLSDSFASFFEGDQADALVFADMNHYRAGVSAFDGTDSFYPETVPEGRRYTVGPGKTDVRQMRVRILVSRKAESSDVHPGPRVLQVQVRRRRLSTVEQLGRTGRTRTWVHLTAQPVILEIPNYLARERCHF